MQRHAAGFIACTEASTGAGLEGDVGCNAAITPTRCLGSAANLNVRRHCLVLDGVYRCGADDVPSFVEVGAPNDDELHTPLRTPAATWDIVFGPRAARSVHMAALRNGAGLAAAALAGSV